MLTLNRVVSATLVTGSILFTTGLALADESPIPISVDLAFLFDRSGSFGDDLNTFRSVSDSLTQDINGRVTDLAVGLSSFIDAPCNGFGKSADFGYEQNLNLTTDLPSLQETLQSVSVTAGSGEDAPESQLEGMYQALTGEGRVVNRGHASCRGVADIASSDLGWRTRTLKFLFVSTDSNFHKSTDSSYPYPTTADQVINAAQAMGVRIYVLFAAGDSAEPDADAYRIAQATGGEVRKLSTDSRELPLIVKEIVERDALEAVASGK